MQKLLSRIQQTNLSSFKLQLIIIVLLSAVPYLNIFQNQLLGDDLTFIQDWHLIRSFDNLPAILSGENPPGHEGVFRPVRGVLYLIMYSLFGTNAWGYHLFSIVTHGAVTALLYVLTEKITRNRLVSFITALLFGLHPLHTEAVTFITASFDTFSYIWLLSSVYFYIASLTEPKFTKPALITGVLAMLSNEINVILVGLLFLYDWLFTKKSSVKSRVKRLTPYLLLTIGYIFVRFVLLDIEARNDYVGKSFTIAILISIKAFLQYLYLSVFPFDLRYVHVLPGNISNYLLEDMFIGYAAAQSFTEPSVIFTILLIVLGLFIGWKFRKKFPLIPFALGWFFISLLPVMNLIPSAFLFSERYAYLASYGICLLGGWGIYTLLRHFSTRKGLIVGGLVLLLISFGARIWIRNLDWKNEVVFWSKTVEQNPENALVNYKLGTTYLREYNFEAAHSYLTRSYELMPIYADAYLAAGYAAYGKEDYHQAINDFNEAVKVNYMYISSARSPLVISHLILAEQAYEAGDPATGDDHLRQAVELNTLDNDLKLRIQQLCSQHQQVCTQLEN